jgi:hypothetical protein
MQHVQNMANQVMFNFAGARSLSEVKERPQYSAVVLPHQPDKTKAVIDAAEAMGMIIPDEGPPPRPVAVDNGELFAVNCELHRLNLPLLSYDPPAEYKHLDNMDSVMMATIKGFCMRLGIRHTVYLPNGLTLFPPSRDNPVWVWSKVSYQPDPRTFRRLQPRHPSVEDVD